MTKEEKMELNSEYGAKNMKVPVAEMIPPDVAPAHVATLADTTRPSQIELLENPDDSFYCSIQNDGSRASAVAVYNAINSKGESLDDNMGKTLEITDVGAHPVSLVDENTGELKECLRIVLIAADGKNYDCVSEGVASSLQKIFAIVGKPTYNPPLKLKVVQQKTRKGNKTNTLELIP